MKEDFVGARISKDDYIEDMVQCRKRPIIVHCKQMDCVFEVDT